MKITLMVAVLICAAMTDTAGRIAAASAKDLRHDLVYQGTWKTTNRKLDGEMTCEVTPRGKEQWRGRFHGIWQGVPFDYTVDFTGPASELRGSATIDGAGYEWAAWMNEKKFKANFSGDRYVGSFELKREKAIESARSREREKTASGRRGESSTNVTTTGALR